ncbi:hypothetical protein Syun_014545 [Stephania yunnanensis]|uniref:Uncharacterized protein n=1 Tax=Stephania yunnanensis TaxID=152371 RepID=A0AAP0JKE6_9MAGN
MSWAPSRSPGINQSGNAPPCRCSTSFTAPLPLQIRCSSSPAPLLLGGFLGDYVAARCPPHSHTTSWSLEPPSVASKSIASRHLCCWSAAAADQPAGLLLLESRSSVGFRTSSSSSRNTACVASW